MRIKTVGGSGGHGIPGLKGVGGNGGNVIIKADQNVKSLNAVKEAFPHSIINAPNGNHSYPHWLVGEPGADLTVNVPCGVKVFSEFFSTMGDLVNHDDQVVAAYGGLGGSARNRFIGEPGNSRVTFLDYRAMADICKWLNMQYE